MFKKLANVILVIPLAVVLIVLSVANRQSVTLALNPFQPSDGVMSVSAPFFVFLFLAVALGILIGSFATWWSQGKHRKRARLEARSAIKWQAEADRNKAQNGNGPAAANALPRVSSK